MPAAIQDRTEHLLKRPPRPHPYARVHHDVRGQYYDFKARPELVGTALEDFVPHRDCAGTDEFFALLRHINRPRSEEHTSELQSLMRISYAVCCLKKKKNKHE